MIVGSYNMLLNKQEGLSLLGLCKIKDRIAVKVHIDLKKVSELVYCGSYCKLGLSNNTEIILQA